MSYQVHTKYADSEEYENVESLDEANKIIKRNKARGAKSADALMFKGKAPEPWKPKGQPLTRALKSGLIDKLLKQAAQIEDQGASQMAQEQLRELFAREKGADITIGGNGLYSGDGQDRVAAAVYVKSVGKRIAPRGAMSPEEAKSMESVNIPDAQPRGIGEGAGLSDTTGPAFRQDTVAGQGAYESSEALDAAPFATGYSQADVDGFNKWLTGLDRDAVERQGWSNADLFRRYMESTKPQVLQFGEDPLKSLGMAPRPDSVPSYNDALGDPTYSVAPKGGPNNS